LVSFEHFHQPSLAAINWRRTGTDYLLVRGAERILSIHDRGVTAMRRRLTGRRTEVADGLVHELVVPAGPDGRPGERLLSASRSLYEPRRPGPDASREDLQVLIGRGSTFAAVCLGRVAEQGTPREAAWATIRAFGIKGFPSSSPVEEEVGGLATWRYRAAINDKRLTEWKFAHAGWLFVAGALCSSPDDEQAMVDQARAMLATWRWESAFPNSG
jgi:hypothetical protein